jgi:hypothetical protein
MISVRGGSGLGDAIYVQSVARYLIEQGYMAEVCSAWTDVFLPLGQRVRVSKFRRDRIDRVAHYSSRRGVTNTTQWEDVCISAAIPTSTPLRLDWDSVNSKIVLRVLHAAAGRPLVLFGMPRAPFARTDGYGKELLPAKLAMQAVLSELSDAYVVQVGTGNPLYDLNGFHLDLVNRTSVKELIDLAYVCSGVAGQPSYLIPLAESLDLNGLMIWSRRAEKSKHEPVRQITPHKIIHRKDLISAFYDDCGDAELETAVETLCRQIKSRAAA